MDYKHYLPDDILIALGRITVNFAMVESAIRFYIHGLLAPRDQQLGDIVTANVSFRNLVSLTSSLHRHRVSDEGERARLDEILRRALALEEKRNIVTHSRWSALDDPTMVGRWKTTAGKGKGLRHQFQEMSASELHGIADDLLQLYGDVGRFSTSCPWVVTYCTVVINVSDPTP